MWHLSDAQKWTLGATIEKKLKSASFCPKNPANLDTSDLSKFYGVSG
jgi:hypothetical protein